MKKLPVSKSLIIHVEDATLARLEKFREEIYKSTGELLNYDRLIVKLLVIKNTYLGES